MSHTQGVPGFFRRLHTDVDGRLRGLPPVSLCQADIPIDSRHREQHDHRAARQRHIKGIAHHLFKRNIFARGHESDDPDQFIGPRHPI